MGCDLLKRIKGFRQECLKFNFGLRQYHFSKINFGHIQQIIDEESQLICELIYFTKIVFDVGLIIAAHCQCQLQIGFDGSERCFQFMACSRYKLAISFLYLFLIAIILLPFLMSASSIAFRFEISERKAIKSYPSSSFTLEMLRLIKNSLPFL